MREKLSIYLAGRLAERQRLGLGRSLWCFDGSGPDAARPHVRMDGREHVSFVSNDALGLASNPDWRAEVGECFARQAASGTASRLAGGYCDLTRQAEQSWAEYFGHQDCLFLPSGYQANQACLSALLVKDGPVLVDRRIHASLAWALKYSQARIHTYPHLDLDRLDRRLAGLPEPGVQPVILTESLFSMDGLGPDMGRLQEIKDRHDAFVIMDEAHACGLWGPGGRGLGAGLAEVRTGTLGKALGFFGAFILLSSELKAVVEHLASAVMHSTALPAAHSAVILRLLARLPGLTPERERVRENSTLFRELLAQAGLAHSGQGHIIAVPVGDEKACLRAGEYLRQGGVLALAARHPTVPIGQALLRFGLTARHTASHLQKTVELLRDFFDSNKPVGSAGP